MHTTNPFEGLDDYSINLIRYKTRRLVGQAGFTASDRDDIEIELALHLWQHLPKHDPTRGTLKTFINCVLDNKIRTMVAARITSRYDVRMHGSSLDEMLPTDSGGRVCRGDIIDAEDYLMGIGYQNRPSMELVELQADVSRLLAKLTPETRDLCERLGHQDIVDIARETGIPRYKIYEIKKRLRFIFEQNGLDGYA